MKFLVAVLMIRSIMNLFSRKNTQGEPESTGDCSVMHPAGHELRDHFCMRCSDETLS